MGHIYKWLGSKEQAKQLWENRESLEKYLSRLKELMEGDNPSSLESEKASDGNNVDHSLKKTQRTL